METKYFYCYDQRFAKYLKSKGFDYITLAKSRHTNKLFSLWEITDEFEKELEEAGFRETVDEQDACFWDNPTTVEKIEIW